MKKFLVAIDQGTTSTRAILFDVKGNVKFISQFEFKQYFPKNGWVEHDPKEIWLTTLKALKKVINRALRLKGKILSIGITNQRETTILWNKKTGRPVYNAIVWQDRRTHKYCEKLKKNKLEKSFRKKTGLFIDPYFSATKIKWILDNVPITKKLLKSNDLLFGTIDTFLIWKLTSGKKHLTEATNASRTMLYNINNNLDFFTLSNIHFIFVAEKYGSINNPVFFLMFFSYLLFLSVSQYSCVLLSCQTIAL